MDTNRNRKEKNVTAFLKGVETPDIVREKAKEAFRQIRAEGRAEADGSEAGRLWNCQSRRQAFYLPKAAVIVASAFLIFGTTAAAIGIGSLYRQRMEAMDEASIETYYEIANAGETTEYNRPFTDEEKIRHRQLEEEYEKSGLFPQFSITSLQAGETYAGKGIALDESTCTIYLPQESLSDEELLEIIDFNHKLTYSIYAKRQAEIMQGDNWESRMAAMTDDEVDRIYLIMTSANTEVSGGYSRELTKKESERYDALVKAYEEEGKYVETEPSVIQKPEEYTGTGVAICISDSTYYLPQGELTDEEFLQIIDFEHKCLSCFDRLWNDIQMGLRTGYPGSDGGTFSLPETVLTDEELLQIELKEQRER